MSCGMKSYISNSYESPVRRRTDPAMTVSVPLNRGNNVSSLVLPYLSYYVPVPGFNSKTYWTGLESRYIARAQNYRHNLYTNMGIDGSSDDESGIIPERATKHPKSASFDFDDAFEDEDDHDPGFKLSSAAIREELARNHSLREDEDDLEAEDTSVAPSSNGRSRHSPH